MSTAQTIYLPSSPLSLSQKRFTIIRRSNETNLFYDLCTKLSVLFSKNFIERYRIFIDFHLSINRENLHITISVLTAVSVSLKHSTVLKIIYNSRFMIKIIKDEILFLQKKYLYLLYIRTE